MKRFKIIFLTILLVATLVPTQIFHYIHVVTDLSEHYQHHKEKPIIEFLAHALSSTNQKDTSHPDHHHSPFHHHHYSCAITFVSIIPEFLVFTIQQNLRYLEKEGHKFDYKSPFIQEVTSSIWQPPKLV